jgi:putative SOS response-associated peptidase YedK
MCGRFAFTKKDLVKSRFRVDQLPEDLQVSYNIAPGQKVPVILNVMPDEVSLAHWGLIPHWAKDEKIGYKMINARAETIGEKPSFRGPIRRQRCLILADAFYEWKKGEDAKIPHRVILKDEGLFAMAGIWDHWRSGEKHVTSCSIITTVSNSLMQPIHDRMPVILPQEAEQAWLGDMPFDEVQKLLKPYDPKALRAYAISSLVNSPRNDHADIIKPVNIE